MSFAFMLDTDTISYALRGEGNIAARLLQHTPSEICMSSISAAELSFGAARRKSRRLAALIDSFCRTVSVVPFDERAAATYGPTAAALLRKGTPIGALDTLIAAHAKSLKLILVTNNIRHFGRVEGLRVENWMS